MSSSSCTVFQADSTISGQSKTADILFATELAKRYADQGLTAFSLDVSWTR